MRELKNGNKNADEPRVRMIILVKYFIYIWFSIIVIPDYSELKKWG
jgi:hypothetical protein